MFGMNVIRGQREFKDAGDKLLVTSLFLTLQGEGPYAGRPAFFVRLAYCNLACSFCDTFFDDGQWFDVHPNADDSNDDLLAVIDQRIREYFKGKVPAWADLDYSYGVPAPRDIVLVITGGEPMLQKNLGPFLERAKDHFVKTQIESNGILLQDIPPSTTLVVSPKCREIDNGEPTKYIEPNVNALARADCLKFVMEAAEGSPYASVPDWALRWRERMGKPIYVSPMNKYNRLPAAAQRLRDKQQPSTLEQRSTVDEVVSFWEEGLLDMEANRRNHEYAAQYAIKHGLYLSLQMHLFASVA